jgi:hypothetical protein
MPRIPIIDRAAMNAEQARAPRARAPAAVRSITLPRK